VSSLVGRGGQFRLVDRCDDAVVVVQQAALFQPAVFHWCCCRRQRGRRDGDARDGTPWPGSPAPVVEHLASLKSTVALVRAFRLVIRDSLRFLFPCPFSILFRSLNDFRARWDARVRSKAPRRSREKRRRGGRRGRNGDGKERESKPCEKKQSASPLWKKTESFFLFSLPKENIKCKRQRIHSFSRITACVYVCVRKRKRERDVPSLSLSLSQALSSSSTTPHPLDASHRPSV